MAAPTFLRETPGGTLLSVKLQPRASQNEIGEPLGDELKIKVTAPPVDAAANQALVELLAETLGCSRGKVELTRGQTSRHKTVMLHGFKPEDVGSKLQNAAKAGGKNKFRAAGNRPLAYPPFSAGK